MLAGVFALHAELLWREEPKSRPDEEILMQSMRRGDSDPLEGDKAGYAIDEEHKLIEKENETFTASSS